MLKVLTAEQMREVDRLTTERYGIPSGILMENAAHAVARVITEKLGGSIEGRRILILCGKGNNGGDGAALARILWNQGASCFVDLIGSVAETTGDARTNFDAVKAVSDSPYTNGPNENCLFLREISEENRETFFYEWRNQHMCMLVDALFGTGLKGPLEGSFKKIAEAVVRAKERGVFESVFAVDLPSGLDADSANANVISCEADVTVTFTAPKLANVIPPAANRNGELVVASIGSPPELIDQQSSQLFLTERADSRSWLKYADFSVDSYKNKRGHALIVAGSENYSGAAVMCGNAAMRSGVGLTTLCVPGSVKAEVASRVMPEVIVRAIAENENGEIESDAFKNNAEVFAIADAIAVGCGLSATDTGVKKLVREIVENRRVPVIVDAGALWFLNQPDGLLHKPADGQETTLDPASLPPLILTPHDGEFLRLLGTDDKDAIKDRVAAVRDFATANDIILVLKGERVLIGEPGGKVVVNPTGNSGLGKAGNGDTLAGILVGFVAQAPKMNIDIFETVVAAVYVAGLAGDVAEKKFGKRVMTASDVRECLVDVFATLSEK